MDMILSKVLSAIFDTKIIVKIVDNVIDVYINGIGGCVLKIKEKDVEVMQFDISEQMLEKIRQAITSCLE